jgi:xyloglucan 6-xylosyltransferase
VESGRKSKQLQLKDAQQLQGPILCGFVTLLVFRGTPVGRNVYSVHAAQDLSALHGIHLQEVGGGSSNEALRRMLNVENKEEEENDPPPRDSNVPYTLGSEIKDWNEQRALWMSKNPQMAKTSNDKKDLILLVSGSQPKPCDNPVGDHYLVKAMKNKIDYCRLQYGIFGPRNIGLLVQITFDTKADASST